MIKKFIYLFLFLSFAVNGQQTINKLITKELTVQDKVEVTSTTKSSKPCPVMTEVQRDAISSPATGSCVYNSNSLQLNVYDGTTWQEAGGGGISLWETAVSYDVNDVVIESDKIYRCIVAHTSGTFATDLSNGNWTEVSATDLAGASGVLSVANGGTGSATQNFVDLTTNQTVGGEKTFSSTLKSDSIQTTGSSGVVIKNSSGTTVADFGPTNTTNASIVGGLNVGGNVTGANLSGTNTGDLTTGGDNDTPAATSTIVAPNKQLTLTGTNQYRLNTGNANELNNSNFEHSTVTTGWTVSNATASGNTANPLEGKKSLSLALTGALSLSQSSTINAAQKSGVQMVASVWVNSSDVSDLRLCSLKNGAEDKCTVTGGYVQGSGWRQLTVSFLGNSTSNGLKLKSTDTTGTVLVDQAYVGIGSPIVDFTPDMVFSAKVSGFGVVSDENTDWLSGNCNNPGTGQFNCNFVSGIFQVAPNCVISGTYSSVNDGNATISNTSATNTGNIRIYQAGVLAPGDFNIVCQKQGADYKTSKAYVASSSDFGYRNAGTITIAATTTNPTKGTVVTDRIFASRKGQRLNAIYQYQQSSAGSAGSGEYLFSLPSGLSFDTNIITPYTGGFNPNTIAQVKAYVGTASCAGAATTTIGVAYAYSATQFRIYCFESTNNGAVYPSYVSSYAYPLSNSSVGFSAQLDAPIQGWTDSGVIVGSFQGYNETPGTSRVETFSVSYGTTNATTNCTASPCSYLDQIGSNVTSITRSVAGTYTLNLNKTYSKLKCSGSILASGSGGGTLDPASCSSCSALTYTTRTVVNSNIIDSYGTLLCQGIPQ